MAIIGPMLVRRAVTLMGIFAHEVPAVGPNGL